MGLDLVDFVMAVEDAFGIAIPNDDAALMRTPRDVVAFVQRTVSAGDSPVCFSQRLLQAPRRSEFLAVYIPSLLKQAHEGWSRAEIERIVRSLMDEELGITKFNWDDEFIRDLRVE